MDEGRAWIEEQVRRSEKEYEDIGGLDGRITENGAYEDYELMLRVVGFLGENHPEYDENEDGIVVTHSEPISKKSQYIFGRSRTPSVLFYSERYGWLFSKVRCPWNDDLCKVRPCGLFLDVFREVGHDWLKMLSIGHIWFDVSIVQRRIIQV
jgi:hypothetical protein